MERKYPKFGIINDIKMCVFRLWRDRLSMINILTVRCIWSLKIYIFNIVSEHYSLLKYITVWLLRYSPSTKILRKKNSPKFYHSSKSQYNLSINYCMAKIFNCLDIFLLISWFPTKMRFHRTVLTLIACYLAYWRRWDKYICHLDCKIGMFLLLLSPL